VPEGNGAQMHSSLGTVTVKPGEVVKVQFGGGERRVLGKVFFADTNAPKDLSHATVTLHSGATFKMLQRLQQAKTQEERMALFQSAEYQQTFMAPREYPVTMLDDGAIKSEGIAPGKYELGVYFNDRNTMVYPPSNNVFMSPQEIIIPAANTNDDAPVDLGTIELKKLVLPVLQAEPGGK
jgi:hypothetical protein